MFRAPPACNPTIMYRKTQQPAAEPLTRRDKRGIAIVGALLLAGFAALGIWAAVRPGGYGQSHDGCVTVTAPSSTGGGLLHACGASAKAMCRAAFTHDDKLSLLTRPQCRLAGLGPASVTVPSGSNP
jgi:hypothetical protein